MLNPSASEVRYSTIRQLTRSSESTLIFLCHFFWALISGIALAKYSEDIALLLSAGNIQPRRPDIYEPNGDSQWATV